MPFIPATNVAQVELIYSWDGQVVESVLHYQLGLGWNVGAFNDLGSQLVTWWDGSPQTDAPTSLSLTQIKMTDLTTLTSPFAVYNAGLPLVGANASNSLPNNCAMVVTKRTELRGRSFRGRIYHPGLTEAQVTGNTVSSALQANILAQYEAIRELTIATETALMVVVSRYSAGDPRGAAVVTPVSNFTTDGVVDSQRRRLPRRGN